MVAAPQISAEQCERRSAERASVKVPAVMRTSYSTIVGDLSDISSTGARFEAGDVPRPAVSVLLEWEGHEAFCRVIWSKRDACGVAFDRPISAHAVADAIEQTRRIEPAAEVSKIPLGTRRNRFRIADPGEAG